MKTRFLLLVLSLFVGLFGANSVFAGAAEAKARIKERRASLDHLKQSEAVGENNKGFVEVRKPGGEAAAAVAAENKDREELFAETAAKTGSTAEAVGKSFAKQLAGRADAVGWFQSEDGSWHKK